MTERDPYSEMHHADDLRWLADRLARHCDAALARGDVLLASRLEAACGALLDDSPPDAEPVAAPVPRARAKRRPWDERAVPPARTRGVQ